MKINGYRCDNCGDEHLITPFSVLSSADGAPIGWFTVKKSALLIGPTWIFCSMGCLYQWGGHRIRSEAKEEKEDE